MQPNSAPAPGGASPPIGANDLPAECRDYEAEVKKIIGCPKVSQATRDALDQSYKQTAAAWYQVPRDQVAVLAQACKAARDAVRTADVCP